MPVLLLLLLLVTAAGCAARLPSVRVAPDAALESLAGECQGAYVGRNSSGTIVFRLDADEHHAAGRSEHHAPNQDFVKPSPICQLQFPVDSYGAEQRHAKGTAERRTERPPFLFGQRLDDMRCRSSARPLTQSVTWSRAYCSDAPSGMTAMTRLPSAETE